MNLRLRQERRFVGHFLCLSAFFWGFAFTFISVPGRADPASTIQTLMIVDQGAFLTFQWSFYFVDFPNRFVLEEDHSKIITLDDPSTLYENVLEIVTAAFDLRIDGQRVYPNKISRLTISPKKICTVTMIYRGKPGGHVELRAPVLRYLPDTGMINYEIFPLGHPDRIVTGNLMGHKGPFPELIVYQAVSDTDQSVPTMESETAVLFKLAFKSVWINANWLFISIILLLAFSPRKAVVSLLALTLAWSAIATFSVVAKVGVQWSLPEVILALPTSLLGIVTSKRPQQWFWPTFITCNAVFFNAVYDLQQVRLITEDRTLSTSVILSLGFACSISSAWLVFYFFIRECKKYREFEVVWVPKVCWIIAALSIFLPLQKMFFG